MAIETDPTTTRSPLSRERVLSAAIALADARGIEALTMRNLAEDLGVEAMSLYYHVTNKESLLDGIVDTIVAQINEAVADFEPPAHPAGWKAAMRERILTARAVMMRHKWVPPVIETRSKMSFEVVIYFNGLLEVFRAGGFSYDLAHHAMHALGSRALGFSMELFEPANDADEQQNDEMMAEMAGRFPFIMEMLSEIVHDDPEETLGWCDDETEFKFGLDLLLDGLDRLNTGEAS